MGRPGLDHGEPTPDALIDSLVYSGSDESPRAQRFVVSVPYDLEIGSGRGIVHNLAQRFGLGHSFGLLLCGSKYEDTQPYRHKGTEPRFSPPFQKHVSNSPSKSQCGKELK